MSVYKQDMLTEGWEERFRERLRAYIAQPGKSARKLSAAVGSGPNHVNQILSKNAIPRADNFEALLRELGPTDRLYIESGLQIREDLVDVVEMIQRLDRDQYRIFLRFLRSLLGSEDS